VAAGIGWRGDDLRPPGLVRPSIDASVTTEATLIYSLARGLVLFTPPKCAANTLHDLLVTQGCQTVLGPQLDGGVDIHTTVLPWDVYARLGAYTFAVSVRHPYERAASLYGHYRRFWQTPHLPFLDFLRQFVVAPRFAFFHSTISAMLQPVEQPLDGRPPLRAARVVRVESLAADLRALGFTVPDPMPRSNRSENRGRAEFCAEAMRLVDAWAWHDFQRFGYRPGIDGLA
jgi:hypothetical protein